MSSYILGYSAAREGLPGISPYVPGSAPDFYWRAGWADAVQGIPRAF